MPAHLPRLLVIMGSGETSPTMTSTHVDLFSRLGTPPVPAVVLDTPFGFQENAAEIAAKALQYFRESVGRDLGVASYRDRGEAGSLEYETMLARLREARYVFAGPGSPSYAVRQWLGSDVPEALADKLRGGGCVVFSSAAACTLGRLCLPVYEIYKVGEPVRWLQGLDLMRVAGIDAAVIPHFDNAEGGTHDTRYCYMGERRLRMLEEQLPEEMFVLGVDEHSACVIDLDAGSATVRGRGGVTLRRSGAVERVEAGETLPLAHLRGGALTLGAARAVAPGVGGDGQPAAVAAAGADPFWEGVEQQQQQFDAALRDGHVDAALTAVLALEGHMWDWSRDTLDSDAMDRARSLSRTMLVRLGDLAQLGARDPAVLVAPFVEAILEQRRRARRERRFADADSLRESLLALGVEVNDGREGATTWTLVEAASRAPEPAEPAPTRRAG